MATSTAPAPSAVRRPTPPVLRVVERECAGLPPALARARVLDVPQPDRSSSPRWASGSAGLVDEHAGRRRAASPTSTSSRPGCWSRARCSSRPAKSMWPVLGGVKWIRFYHGMVATPIRAARRVRRLRAVERDPHRGRRSRCSSSSPRCSARSRRRGACSRSPPPRCARPRSARRSARSRSRRRPTSSFPVIMRLGILPLFLFSGTFFPISELPNWLRTARGALAAVARRRARPTRDHRRPRRSGRCCAHVAVLVAVVVAGWLAGTRTFTRRLAG